MGLGLKLGMVGLAFGLLAQPMMAFAADTLPGDPGSVHKSFNAIARKIEARQRMVLTKCGKAQVRTCNYTVTGRLGVVAASPDGQPGKLASITVIYASGSNATDMIIAMGIMMLIYSPDSDQSERSLAISTLGKTINSGEKTAQVTLEDTSYTIAFYESLGLWFIIKPF